VPKFESDYVFINVDLDEMPDDFEGNAVVSSLRLKAISKTKEEGNHFVSRKNVDRGELNSARLRVIFEKEGVDKKKQIR
jgi:hypothetical protein